MSHARNRPSAVILDLLRSARGRGYAAGALIEAGALFGFAENTMRVTLSRLTAKGTIESPRRGVYRLSHRTDALNEFVERWRLGEDRVRPWQAGAWVFAHAPTADAHTGWVLDALGFRAPREGLYVRPDNLALTLSELRALGTGLGLPEDVLLATGTPEGEATPQAWVALWQPEALDAAYVDALQRLEASSARLRILPADEARLECFTLGGEMIHRLAKDPLLPQSWVDARARRDLVRALLDYDKLGKSIWAQTGDHPKLNQMPRPQLATAGPAAP